MMYVSDKRIPEWLSISCSQQEWGLVYWEAACLVWSPESCVTAARCSCARVVHWKVKVTSNLTDVWRLLFEQQDIIVKSNMHHHYHPWLHENHISAPAHRDTDLNRNAGTCLSKTNPSAGIWLKYGQRPAELHWSIDRSVTRLFYCVSQSQKQTLWAFAMICFSMICNCHDF